MTDDWITPPDDHPVDANDWISVPDDHPYVTDPVRTAYQATMNNVAKPINNVVGSVVGAASSLIPEKFKQGASEFGNYLANEDLITSPVYTAAKEGLTQIGENLDDLKSYSPDLAHDLPALSQNVQLAGNMALIKPVSEIAGVGLSKTGQSMVESAADAAQAKRNKEIFDIITPKQTPTIAKDLGTRSTSEGLNAVRTPQPTDFENKIINTVSDLTDEKGNPLIKKGQPLHETYNKLSSANEAEAEALKAKLAASDAANPKNAIIPKSEILDTVAKELSPLDKNPYLSGSNHLDTVFNDLASQIPEEGATASQLLDIRKKLDKNIAKYKGEGGLDPVRENAFTEAGKIVRQTTNDIVANKYPDAAVRKSLDKQFHIYNAMDAVETKIPTQSATRIGRTLDKVRPFLPKTVAGALESGALLGAGYALPASVSLPLAGIGATGYGAYKILTSPTVQKAFGLTLDKAGQILRGGKPLATDEAQAIIKMLPNADKKLALPAPDTIYAGGRSKQPIPLTPEEKAASDALQNKAVETGLTSDVQKAQQKAKISEYERNNPANKFFNTVRNKPIKKSQTALHPDTGDVRKIFPDKDEYSKGGSVRKNLTAEFLATRKKA
jgi:hypothetical protein